MPLNIIKNRSVTLLPNQYKLFHIINYEFYLFCIIFPYYFCHKPKQHVIKKILLILITAQFIIAPQIIKSFGANNSHEYLEVNQKKKTVKKDILGNTVIEDDKGNKKTIKKDIFDNIIIEDY